MITSEALIRLLNDGQSMLLQVAAALPVEQQTSCGTLDHWSGKDLLAHIGEWKRRRASQLSQAGRDEKPFFDNDFDPANALIFEQYRNYSWEAVLVFVNMTHQELISQAARFSEAALNDPTYFPWTNGRPLWRFILISGFQHQNMHLGEFYLQNGDPEAARQLWEQEARQLIALENEPNWQGVVHYNLACRYAQLKEQSNALIALENALSLRPDLIGWAQQDTDLAALRDQAGFLALVERLGGAAQHVNPTLDRDRLVQVLTTVLDHVAQGKPGGEYRLVGTGAALLHGVQLPAGDIDLLVKQRAAVDEFARALADFRCLTPPTYLPDARQYFAEFEVQGVEVGISTVEWETESDGVECLGRGPWEHYALLTCGAHQVPAVALELRLVSELLRQRKERYEPLLNYLQIHGCDIALVQRGMQARQLPTALQERVLEQLQPAKQV